MKLWLVDGAGTCWPRPSIEPWVTDCGTRILSSGGRGLPPAREPEDEGHLADADSGLLQQVGEQLRHRKAGRRRRYVPGERAPAATGTDAGSPTGRPLAPGPEHASVASGRTGLRGALLGFAPSSG